MGGKPCQFCTDGTEWIDYKDSALLGRFVSDRGRIRARGATGTCARHQRDVAMAVKTARELALLPYGEARPVAGSRRVSGSRSSAQPNRHTIKEVV